MLLNASGLLGSSAWAITPGGVAVGLLPLVVFCALTLVVASYRARTIGRLRESMLVAGLLCGVWVVAGTEFLSLFRSIRFWPVLLWWLVPAVALTALAFRRRNEIRGLFVVPRVPWGAWAPLGLTAFLTLLAGAAAAISSPTTSDALRYHMPRQVRWFQQESVEHFAGNARQLVTSPMAEFAGLHFLVLSNGDFFASLIQWFALVLAAVAASLVTRQLGGGVIAQTMAALLVVSSPMTWLQASTVKNDVVAALWVMVVAYGVVRVLKESRCSISWAMLVGAATGLAMLTKPTGAMFVLPLLLLFGGWLLIQNRLRCIPAGLVVVTVVLAVNSGHFARNMRMFDSPNPNIIQYQGRPLSNETWSAAAVGSNVVRNLGLQLGTPWPTVNDATLRVISQLHEAVGQDINDDRTTVYNDFLVGYTQLQESRTASPLHVLLFAGAVFLLPFVAWRSARSPTYGRPKMTLGNAWRTGAMMAATVGALVVFALMLKWQPWHARLHIGILALAAPAIAVVLCRGRGVAAIVVSAALMVPLVPTMLWNDTRPLIGPGNLWTTSRDEMQDRRHPRDATNEVVAFLREAKPQVLGVLLTGDGEYAMVRRLLFQLDPPPRITDPFAPKGRRMALPWPAPDLVLTDLVSHEKFSDNSSGVEVYFVHSVGPYRIYARAEVAEQLREVGLLTEPPD